jgi:hypothetical protein
MYRAGDYVYLPEVSGSVLCRVAAAENVTLELEPLEGPWPAGTRLIRLDRAVRPADARTLWRAGGAPPQRTRPDRRLHKRGAAA